MKFYNELIAFVIFVLFHKMVALAVLFNVSIVKIRHIFNYVEPICIIFFLSVFDLNIYMKSLMFLFLLAPINYWLCDRGYIYLFIDDNEYNNKIVKKVSYYGDVAINIIVLTYSLYFLLLLAYL